MKTLSISVFSTVLAVSVIFASFNLSWAEETAAETDGAISAAAVTLLYKSLGDHLRKNYKGAGRESGEIDKLVKAITGISTIDIKKYGFCGGPNSELRKILGSKTCGAAK